MFTVAYIVRWSRLITLFGRSLRLFCESLQKLSLGCTYLRKISTRNIHIFLVYYTYCTFFCFVLLANVFAHLNTFYSIRMIPRFELSVVNRCLALHSRVCFFSSLYFSSEAQQGLACIFEYYSQCPELQQNSENTANIPSQEEFARMCAAISGGGMGGGGMGLNEHTSIFYVVVLLIQFDLPFN